MSLEDILETWLHITKQNPQKPQLVGGPMVDVQPIFGTLSNCIYVQLLNQRGKTSLCKTTCQENAIPPKNWTHKEYLKNLNC